MTKGIAPNRANGTGAGGAAPAARARTQLEPLGSPARVRITKVVRTSYRIEWEYDGHFFSFDRDTGSSEYIPVRKRQVKHVQVRTLAYRSAAIRLIFSRRNRYFKAVTDGKFVGCTLCETNPVNPWAREEPQACRYHDGESVLRLRDRLARWLMWRDARAAAP